MSVPGFGRCVKEDAAIPVGSIRVYVYIYVASPSTVQFTCLTIRLSYAVAAEYL